jgi:Ca2+-binding RTX toxin-like protein
VAVAHTYTAAGTYTVKVWATDKDGLEGAFASRTYTAKAVELQGNDLVIGGTTAADQIVITATSTANAVQVSINGANQGTFTAPGQIVVFAQAGDDTVSFATTKVQGTTYSVAQALALFGGAGNDTLDARNATGPAVIVGGDGNDTLYAGPGRSILIGGLGADTLRGGGADDILIGGITDYDDDLATLAALRAEWGRTDATYAVRQAHLLGPTGGLNGTAFLNAAHIHDDGGAVDNLYGNGGQDWFFAPPTDKVNDRQSGETVTVL